MMKLVKFAVAAALAGALVLPGAAMSAERHRGGGGHSSAHAGASHSSASRASRSVGVRNSARVSRSANVRGGRNFSSRRGSGVRVGARYGNGYWYGARRHYWNGRWYGYGVGSCWSWTPIGYIWVCGI
jgi:hypothetical protein